jgi:hypothetical protein
MRVKQIIGAAVIALGITGALGAGSAQAQAYGPDLDLTQCTIVDDPYDYGDGIDWYKLHYTYVNEGNASTGTAAFKNRARPVWGIDEFSGQLNNEANVTWMQQPMAANTSRSGFFWLTKRVVDQRTWGIFLDVNGQVPDVQFNDNFCSFYVNNS